MEIFRIMRNVTRQATVDTRTDILCKFVRKLRRSGYVQMSVEVIGGRKTHK